MTAATSNGQNTPAGDVDELYPPEVREATPTATAVYATLQRAGPMSYAQLASTTGMSTRAVKQAVYDLRDNDLVRSTPDPRTPSQHVHRAVVV